MDVYFGGTKEQWEAVRIGDENDSLRDATIHFGSSANGLDEDKKYKVFRMGGYESFDISLEDCMGKEASSVYNPQLAHMLIAMCNAVNGDSDMSKTFYSFGMQEQERIGGLFLTYSMGRKDLGNGEKLRFCIFLPDSELVFPDFSGWPASLKNPRKSWTYEMEVMLMTVVMKNVFCISSMQKMTDEFIKDECVKSLCTMLGVPEHEFLPHYVIVNEFLSKMNTEELEKFRRVH